MDSITADRYLTKWAERMRPSTAPFDRSDSIREEWALVLKATNGHTANAAWREWIDSGATRWPTLYAFQNLIRKHTDHTPEDKCPDCHNGGWVPGPDFDQNGHTYTSAQPCTCSEGDRARGSRIWRDRETV